jgi:excisionase family DNA binding protein
MAQILKSSSRRNASLSSLPREASEAPAGCDLLDPRAFGLIKAAYSVNETLDLLRIGRTSLYEAIKRGELRQTKFGKKTLFYAADLAAFLTGLRSAD